ncbi:MAG: ABC transporter ATP-binding protein/permease [Mogibacterium sp.]|nr:ABC transporter ATP-binding protein/permease [Mogibacterium sp.]
MIRIDNVNKYYNKGKANQIHVIDNTSVELPDKGIFCILGPSGCGKTTLLNAIGGLDKVNSGKITIDDQTITGASSDKIDSIRNANIGYIFQDFNLLDDRTVFENVAIALRMVGVTDHDVVTDRVRYCLKKTGIDQYRNKPAGALSGGQRQRVAIARAIVKNPSIILADEPTGNLDSANTLEIMNIIKTISKDKLVILVTHERNIAEFYSDYVAEIKDGKIVSIYDNNTSRSLDYQLENKIYLKDMEFHKELRQDDVSIDVYSDTERLTDIKLVVRDNTIYISTGEKLNVADNNTNVELIDDHYTVIDETIFEENDFDYTAYLPPDYKAKYTSIYKLSNIISNGWRTLESFSAIKKLLLLGFVFAAMFAFMAVSNVFGLLEVKPVDYRTTNGNYLTVSNAERTEYLLDLVESLESVSYVLPGETKKSVTLPLNDYIQTSNAQEDIIVSIALSSVLEPEQLIAGSMPAGPQDVVLDKAVIDDFLRDDLGREICLDTMDEFIGRKIKVPNLNDYRIVGITDTESPSLFVDPDQAMFIITNASDATGEISLDFLEDDAPDTDIVSSGKVKDIELSENAIKIKKGRKPENAYEVVVNYSNKDDKDMAIGKAIETKVAGRNLTVVGFYTSNVADDDTYYVHADTIRKHYIKKQKYFSVYAQDPALLKAIFDETGVPSKVNDVRDKNIYISAHRDQLISSIIVAGIIMLISLIEMFLILRSSFLSRIREVGTLRAIGLKKGDIYRMFTGEIIVISLITAIPGIAIMYLALSGLVRTTYYLEGLYILTPAIAAITLAIILVFNLIAGLIPVFATMRKTPAEILARTDI